MGTFLRESGGSAAWFGTYEYVSSFLKSYRRQTDIPAQDLMLSGACAGMAYNLSVIPCRFYKISDADGCDFGWTLVKGILGGRERNVEVWWNQCFLSGLFDYCFTCCTVECCYFLDL